MAKPISTGESTWALIERRKIEAQGGLLKNLSQGRIGVMVFVDTCQP